MADNVLLNAGSGGETLATDQLAGGEHVQFVKLMSGTLNASDKIAGDATNGLDVDVTRVQGTVTVDGSGVTQPVSAASLPLPAGAATAAKQDDQTAALQLIDDVVHASDAALGKVAAIGAQFDDTTPGTTTENNVRPLRMSTRRELYAQIRDAAGNERGLNIDASNRLGVVADAGANLNTSALALEAGGNLAAAVTALQIIDDWDNAASDGCSVSGDAAHDAADAGEPVKLGHKAIDLGANPADVAANDRTNWYSMRNGVPFVIGGAPFVRSQNLEVTDADGAQTDVAIVTVAANVAIVVTAIEVCAHNANTVNVSCRIGFGTVNTPAPDADKVVLFHPGIAAGSGVVKGSGAGIIGAGLSGEDLRITCADPVTGSLSITVTYFTLAIG